MAPRFGAWRDTARSRLYGLRVDPALLRKMGAERLAAMLARRPDLARPEPTDLAALATRMVRPEGVIDAFARMPLPTVQVAEAAAAMGGAADRTTLLNMIGRHDEATAAAVDRALDQLVEHGLAVPDGDIHVLTPAAVIIFPDPLRMGAPVHLYLDHLPLDRLRTIADRLGVGLPGKGREAALRTLVGALSETERVRKLVDAAPKRLGEALRALALEGGFIRVPTYGRYGIPQSHPELDWATARCLLVPAYGEDFELVMPAEVAVALRGPEYQVPFDPAEPYLPRAAVDQASVARDCAAAAASLLRVAARLLDEAAADTLAGLRTGGVGVRELKRIAKAAGCDVGQVRLALALAHAAGLLALTGEGPSPTDLGQSWLDEEPPHQMAALVRAWSTLDYSPLMAPDRWLPAAHDGCAALRGVALTLIAEEAGAPTDPDAFAARLRWRHPLFFGDLGEPEPALAAWREEAGLLGVLGAGAISEIGRAVVAQDLAALDAALAGVGSSVRVAHLQADLTAVVAGTPTSTLTDLLGALAIREASGAASTWRFSPETVRRALDTGWLAEEILSRLEAVAAAGVPQTLSYLVRDVARRHGALRASSVACCVRGEDPSLLAEVAADRRLRDLGLRLLAPTVLASAVALPETLAALRRAGYAPVTEGADGATVLERAARREPVVAPRPRRAVDSTVEAELITDDAAQELARDLINRPDGTMRASIFAAYDGLIEPEDGAPDGPMRGGTMFDDAEQAAIDALRASGFLLDEPDDDPPWPPRGRRRR